MNEKIRLTTVVLILLTTYSFGQVGGNSILNGSSNYCRPAGGSECITQLQLSDSSFIVQSNVLMNVIADTYVITFGLSNSSESLKKANADINERIDNFTSALEKMGIQREDIYVDMTTQTQLTDYEDETEYREEYVSGFEKKRI